MKPRIITAAERAARRRAGPGLGDRVRRVVHAGLEVLPLQASTRQRLKRCSACARRVGWLNRLGRALHRLVS